ncbi:MAG: hypothetical protein JWM02_1402 [Frankiales bacterium]|nr:hypothetical protein [Frankiales bacterium]
MTEVRLSDFAGRRFWRSFANSALACIGLLAMAGGLWDVLFPDTLPKVGTPAAVTVLLAGLAYGLISNRPQPVERTYDSPAVKIRVVAGDLFDAQAHLVVGMSDTFDTATDIIAANSIQAQFLRRFYGGDVDRLDRDLAEALQGVRTSHAAAKAGKTMRYPLGTVATLGGPERRFFLVAYSGMNDRNEARASVDGVWESLGSVWTTACAHGNGGPLAMAVIGGGQSRLSQSLSTADAIRLQVMSFWLRSREERFSDELMIVVARDKYDELDRREIQAFLDNLRPS